MMGGGEGCDESAVIGGFYELPWGQEHGAPAEEGSGLPTWRFSRVQVRLKCKPPRSLLTAEPRGDRRGPREAFRRLSNRYFCEHQLPKKMEEGNSEEIQN